MIYVDGGRELRKLTHPGNRLLDIGCGTGLTVSSYRVGMEDVEIYGIDAYHDPSEVRDFIRYVKQDIDGAALPYEDTYFDVVVLCHLLEHIRNPVLLIKEVHRVLKPGGYVYIETPSVRSMLVPDISVFQEQYAALNFFDDFTHIGRPQTRHSLYHLLHRNGFDVVVVDYARTRNWIRKGVAHLIRGFVYKDRVTMCSGMWSLVGWAIYGIGRKNANKTIPSYV